MVAGSNPLGSLLPRHDEPCAGGHVHPSITHVFLHRFPHILAHFGEFFLPELRLVPLSVRYIEEEGINKSKRAGQLEHARIHEGIKNRMFIGLP